MALLDTLQEKREEILQVAASHGAFNVRVFGSVARREDTSESDVDFLISYDPQKTTPWFPGGAADGLTGLARPKSRYFDRARRQPLNSRPGFFRSKIAMKAESDRVYLKHILECTALIQDYTRDGKDAFMSNGLLQDAVLRRLQTMAESTQRLSDELKTQAVEVDWRSLAGFRNVLVHDYMDGIDLERIWDAIENDLPELETVVQRLADPGIE